MQGQNLVLTVPHVPHQLDCGHAHSALDNSRMPKVFPPYSGHRSTEVLATRVKLFKSLCTLNASPSPIDFFLLFLITLKSRVELYTKSMSLNYESASEPLHISVLIASLVLTPPPPPAHKVYAP